MGNALTASARADQSDAAEREVLRNGLNVDEGLLRCITPFFILNMTH
jgi:hypothetical protein